MSPETVLLQIRACRDVVKRNVGEITHEESLRSFRPAGNGLNWTLGHLVATRSAFLRGLGGEPVWSEEEGRLYDRHSPPLADPARAKPLSALWEAYDETQARLEKTLEGLTPERIAAPLPAGAPFRTVGEMVAFLGLHDSYHTGQTGLIRRLLGKPAVDL
jgi:uncharacterized damage-inducible protein DinB